MTDSLLIEIEHLIRAHESCSDEKRREIISEIIAHLISPLVSRRNPKALYLKAGLANLGEEEHLSEFEFDKLWLSLIKESADGGCPEAQYKLGCELYEKNEYHEAVDLYRRAALQGYGPAQWCYGVDILNGIGTAKDLTTGIRYIKYAAEKLNENALNFLIDAIQNNQHQLPAHTDELVYYQTLLQTAERS